MNDVSTFGWDDDLGSAWDEHEYGSFVPGRVIADHGASYKVALPHEISAEISGHLQYVSEPHEMPKIGDWVAVQVVAETHGIIHGVLPRKSEIGRKQPGGRYQKQVLATNVDVAFLIQALDHDFSPERLRRYLFQLSQEGVRALVVLNKADKEHDLDKKLAALGTVDAEVLVTSATSEEGIAEIAAAIKPGQTAVFLGSSGVGKSTITNLLLGEQAQTTSTIREADSKGRHTTTHRELFVLPNGGMVIDTPGLRELQVWGEEGDLGGFFDDIEVLAKDCRFADCTHESEPDCAIREAISRGELSEERLGSYGRLQKELRYLATKVDQRAAYEHKQTDRKVQKYRNQISREKSKRRKQ